jgi:hypothetical protein
MSMGVAQADEIFHLSFVIFHLSSSGVSLGSLSGASMKNEK